MRLLNEQDLSTMLAKQANVLGNKTNVHSLVLRASDH